MYSPCVLLPNNTSTSSAQVLWPPRNALSSYSSCLIAMTSSLFSSRRSSDATCVSWSFSRLTRSSSSISFLISSCAQRHSLWTSLASSGVSPSRAVIGGSPHHFALSHSLHSASSVASHLSCSRMESSLIAAISSEVIPSQIASCCVVKGSGWGGISICGLL